MTKIPGIGTYLTMTSKIFLKITIDKPLLCSEFLQRAFCTDSAKDQILRAFNENYYSCARADRVSQLPGKRFKDSIQLKIKDPLFY